jgi:glyoxylase-like metal-dependent hydrolase (beta-lactamase superfamily II)
MHEFEHRAIHAAEASALRMGDAFEALCSKGQGWVQPDHFDCLPYDGFTVDTYTLNAAEPTQILNDGDVLDLGDRAFEVLHLPVHSPGCIALYDPRAKELFSGDVVYDGELLDGLHGSHVPTYLQTFERLQRLPVETVYPGHYSIVGNARYHEIIREYLDAKRRPGCPSERVVAKG